MKLACPSCRSPFEIDPALAAGPGAPLCEACSAAGVAPPPPPAIRRSRPRLPAISFRPRRASDPAGADAPADAPPAAVADANDDLDMISVPPPAGAPEPLREPERGAGGRDTPVSQRVHDGGFARAASVRPSDPGPMSRRGAELSFDDLTSDVEPVSLHDLGLVLGPSSRPPAWAGAPSPRLQEAASTLKPRSPRSAREATAIGHPPEKPRAAPPPIRKRAAPPPEPPAEPPVEPPPPSRARFAAARERLAASRDNPSFFQVDAPPSDEIPVDLLDAEPPPPSSGRVDLLALVAPPSDPKPQRAGADMLDLRGGLFADAPPAPPVAPAPPSAPHQPPPVPHQPPPVPRRPPPAPRQPLAPVFGVDQVPAPRLAPAPAPDDAPPSTRRRPPRSGAPGPVVSERRPPSRRSGAWGWAAGAVAAAAVLGVVAGRFGAATAPHEEPREPPVNTGAAHPPPPPVPKADERRPEIVVPPPPVPSAEPTSRPAPVVVATATPVAPRPVDTARAAEPRPPRETPPVPSPAVPQPPAPAPPPAPSPAPAPAGGAEFDRAAARTALAAASSMAAGCKQPDDAGGGARVSVTFAPSGRVTASRLAGGAFAGTPTGSCIARAFRTISVPAFAGDPVTITANVSVH
jgi:hypothetical protein